MSMRALSVAAVLLAALGVALFVGTRPPREAPEPSPVDRPAPAAQARAAERTAPVPRPASGAGARIVLPDGSTTRCLNGVEQTMVLTWPPGRPYSPIVGTEFASTGLEWYVHEDGTRSTTQWIVRDDGTREPVGSVYAPLPEPRGRAR